MDENIKIMNDKLVSGEAQIFDVREQEEWEEGHLKLAELVTLSSLQEGEEPNEIFGRSKPTYIHCRSGNRVLIAAPLLEAMGFDEVIPLRQGFEELVSEGMEEV